MLGQLIDASELREDDPFDTLVAVVGSAVLPAMPSAPSTSCTRHVTTLSIIGTEMRLFEELLSFTRSAATLLTFSVCVCVFAVLLEPFLFLPCVHYTTTTIQQSTNTTSRQCQQRVTTLFSMFTSFSYYLARFKDTYRQATIDLMLGNHVSTESLNALGGQTVPDESDALEGAEHARLLVEDCRRMLLGSAQYPIGAWGLIDADPK